MLEVTRFRESKEITSSPAGDGGVVSRDGKACRSGTVEGAKKCCVMVSASQGAYFRIIMVVFSTPDNAFIAVYILLGGSR